MNRKFEFRVSAEFHQFCVKDLTYEDELDWTIEASERRLLVKAGMLVVGTFSDGLVPVVLQVRDGRPVPTNDIGMWVQVNECSLEVQSGSIVIANICDLDDLRFGGLRIDLEPGPYRIRLHYGYIDSPTENGERMDYYKLIFWISEPPGRVMVLKQAPVELTRAK